MDEALIRQLVALGAIPEEQAALMQDMKMGEAHAQAPSAQGTQVNGRIYVAASPLEHLGVALERYAGIRQQKQAREGLQNSFGQQTAGRSAYADALVRALGHQQQPAAGGDPRLSLFGGYGSMAGE